MTTTNRPVMTGAFTGWAIPFPHSHIGDRMRAAIAGAAHWFAQWRLRTHRDEEPYYPVHRLTIFEDAAMEREMYRL